MMTSYSWVRLFLVALLRPESLLDVLNERSFASPAVSELLARPGRAPGCIAAF